MKKFNLGTDKFIILLLLVLVCLFVYGLFFKNSCGCNREHFSNKVVLEIYTAPWCGFCKKFEAGDTINKIKERLGDENVMHYIDGQGESSSKMQQNGVDGFPTIMVTKNGVKKAVHTGERSVDAVCDFYNSHK